MQISRVRAGTLDVATTRVIHTYLSAQVPSWQGWYKQFLKSDINLYLWNNNNNFLNSIPCNFVIFVHNTEIF